MREILFRGFHPNESGEQRAFVNGKWTKGCWVTGNLFLPDNPKTPTQICIGTSTVRISYDVIPETVGQYTGLQEKNGKKIFEGDILKGEVYPFCSNGDYNYFGEIVWFENSPAFGMYTFKNPKSKVRGISQGNCNYLEDFKGKDWEFIGNIFENPELLKGGEE